MANIFSPVFDLLDPEKRRETVSELQNRGLITSENFSAWINELDSQEYNARNISRIICSQKIKLDRLVERFGGDLSARKTISILGPLLELPKQVRDPFGFDAESLKGKVFLDFGAGIYSPLAVSMVLYANGFSRCVAFEPMPIVADVALGGVSQTISNMLLNPRQFNFSGIPDKEFKERLTHLEFAGLFEKIENLNGRNSRVVDLGGVMLVSSLEEISSVDVVLSNSVLEHVADLKSSMSQLHQILADDGLCVHTVDYSDHRAIDSNVNLFEMYYDGVLADINGLRPSDIERIFLDAGFIGTSLTRMNAPSTMGPDLRRLTSTYAGYSVQDLSVWVRSYILRKG
jgi:SAM-dependent methyltransferase